MAQNLVMRQLDERQTEQEVELLPYALFTVMCILSTVGVQMFGKI